MYFLGVEAFLAIVQTKSLTKAADLINLSPSTISYRLKTLEHELGVQLIERRKGISQIRLTHAGENFVNIAERWKTLWLETRILQTIGPQLSLNITAPNSMNIYVLPPLYQCLHQHAPPIRLWIHTGHTIECTERVGNREMDVAFLVREVATPPSLVLEPFFEEQMVLLRLATSDRNELDPVDLKSLEPEYEFYMNWGTGYQSWHDKLWDPLSPYRVRVDVAGIIPHMMSDDRHWAIVANSVGNYLMQSGKFVIQRLSESPPKRICYKLTHKYPSEATLQSLLILKMYLDTVFGRE